MNDITDTRTTRLNRRLRFTYKNHKGEVALRDVVTLERVTWGTTKYHHKGQKLIKCFCLAKNDYRTFALADMSNVKEL